jgi:hypothetical protein
VAQTRLGADFSFLMDDVGKPVQTPDIGLNVGKLQRFIRALEKVEPIKKGRRK